MKHIWEPQDIVAGRFVCKHPSYQGRDHFEPCGSACKWTYKIGFGFWDTQMYALIAMTDGMISNKFKTKEELAKFLNDHALMPMPHKWLIQVIDSLRDCYERE